MGYGLNAERPYIEFTTILIIIDGSSSILSIIIILLLLTYLEIFKKRVKILFLQKFSNDFIY